jgi:hypothetical protein
MIYQNDPRFNEKIRLYGCNFRSLLAIAEVYCDEELTARDIALAYDELVGIAMDVDCTMNAQLSLVPRWAFKKLNHSTYSVAQIGMIEAPAKFDFWKSARVYTIMKGLMHPVGYKGRAYPTYHFRLGNREGKVMFDPVNPAPRMLNEVVSLLYQVVEVS